MAFSNTAKTLPFPPLFHSIFIYFLFSLRHYLLSYILMIFLYSFFLFYRFVREVFVVYWYIFYVCFSGAFCCCSKWQDRWIDSEFKSSMISVENSSGKTVPCSWKMVIKFHSAFHLVFGQVLLNFNKQLFIN